MSGRILIAIGPWLVWGMAGCAPSKPESRLTEAMELAAQRTGQRPEWDTAWDEAAPQWTAESVLTPDEAVVLALRNNRELRADLESIGQASADLLQASLISNPMLNFMVMFPSGGGRSMLWANGLPQMPLQDLWLVPARKKVAKAELQRTVLRVADRAVEIAADVKRVYARLQYYQRAIELLEENLQIIDQSTRIIRIRQTAGQATQVEVNLSEIRRMRMRSDLIAVRAEDQAARRELLMLMGLAGGSATWQVVPLDNAPEEWIVQAGEEELVLAAVEQRLDLKAAEWEVQAAESDISLARREGWPDLAVGIGFQRAAGTPSNNQSLAGRAGNIATRGVVNRALGMPSAPMVREPFKPKMREMKWMVGPMFDLELPIFDWNQAGVARALATYNQRIAQYESSAQQLVRSVRETLVRLRQAHEQLAFYRDSIMPAVEQNLEVARRSYISGQEDLTVYLDVQEDLLNTRLQQVGFLRDYLVNLADLERALGGRLALPEPLPPATQPADVAD